MAIDRLLAALRSREDLRPEPPAVQADFDLFAARFGSQVDARLYDVWKAFDGFENDCGVLVRLWPLKEIADYREDWGQPPGYIAFADEFIWAAAYFFSPDDLSRPILLCYGPDFSKAEIVADNFWEFLQQIASGR